jgi:hypothetical protein
MLLLAQAMALVASRSSVHAYSLGLYMSASSITLAIILLLQDTEILGAVLSRHPLTFALRVASTVASGTLSVASILLPRRPDVFYEDRIVDRMYTVNAYKRMTFSWTDNVLATARKKKDLDASDLPRPDHHSRAKDQSASWKAYNFKGPLWKSIFWAYKYVLAVQWTMCIAGSCLGFAPYWVTLQLLRFLETREKGQSFPVEVWILVIWLGVAIIAQAVRQSLFLVMG